MSYPLGYDKYALGARIPFPHLSEKTEKDALEGGAEIQHLHYSLVVSKVRKMAIVTAHSIQGAFWHDIERQRDLWVPDPQVPLEHQILDGFYAKNPWDKGHLVRRADVCFGKTRTEAALASKETFFYTNAAPQHANFNRDEWLELENWILEKALHHRIPVCVFTGPVFGNCDIVDPRTKLLIPQSFWKVVAFVHPDSKKLVSTAFLMNQTEMWQDPDGHRFIELGLYQVMVKRITRITGVYFGELTEWDVLAHRPDLAKPRILSYLEGPAIRIKRMDNILL